MTTFTQFSEMIERLLGGARCVRITVGERRKNSATRLCWSIGIGGLAMTP